jgi:hypothetical protein
MALLNHRAVSNGSLTGNGPSWLSTNAEMIERGRPPRAPYCALLAPLARLAIMRLVGRAIWIVLAGFSSV